MDEIRHLEGELQQYRVRCISPILLQGCLYLIDVPHLYLLCIALNYLSSHWLRAYGYFANQRNQSINRLICRLCVQCMISKGNVKLCSL